MIKEAPSFGRIFAMVAFTLSCFGILVFLWLSFGGPVPLKPKGYRVEVSFPSATQLAVEADVRISGVPVGTVKTLDPNKQTGLTDAVLEIDARYAPIPADTRATLRQKTLLGETYVEFSPGSRSAPRVADGGQLAAGQVSEAVELDEILRTLDPETRRQFSIWFDQSGQAALGNAENINDALGNLTPFAEETGDVLKVLNQQSDATRRFIRDTGVVFDALTARRGQLRSLVSNSNRAWEAIASRDQELADFFRVFPTFLREGRITTERLTEFAQVTNPLVSQLRPAARQLSPLLIDLEPLSPDLKALFSNLRPLVKASREGLPATEQTLDNTRPLLARLPTYFNQLTPVIGYLDLYRSEITALLASDTAATQATAVGFADANDQLHYIRTMSPVNPEMIAGWPSRLGTNRSNPYVEPRGYDKLGTQGFLDVFGTYLCTTNPTPAPPAANEYLSAEIAEGVEHFVFGFPENQGKAPPCVGQEPAGRLAGQPGRLFPQLQPLP